MTLRLLDTLTGEQRALRAARPGERPRLQLRPDRLRARRTSATSGPSSSPTCSSGTCATAGYAVTWVMNITDVDDKIIRGARADGATIGELAERWTARFLEDAALLRMTTPDVLPRATAHIARDGRRSSRRSWSAATPIGPTTARSSSGSRRGPRTAGWRASTPRRCGWGSGWRRTSTPRTTCATSRSGRAPRRASRPGRPPIGPGRPGWHIECSAMSMRYLGPVVRHPHRRRGPRLPAPRGRDRAERGRDGQALRRRRGCTAPTSRWAARRWPSPPATSPGSPTSSPPGVSPRALRYALIAAHYRMSLSFSEDSLQAATSAVERLDALWAALAAYRSDAPGRPDAPGVAGRGAGRVRGGPRRRPQRRRPRSLPSSSSSGR